MNQLNSSHLVYIDSIYCSRLVIYIFLFAEEASRRQPVSLTSSGFPCQANPVYTVCRPRFQHTQGGQEVEPHWLTPGRAHPSSRRCVCQQPLHTSLSARRRGVPSLPQHLPTLLHCSYTQDTRPQASTWAPCYHPQQHQAALHLRPRCVPHHRPLVQPPDA